jgi:pimeloyl-ACP methyl ester carboxylesterase
MKTDLTSAIEAANQFVEVNGRTLAYRSIGTGKPIVLCTRFRGTLDDWDPAFIDALARNGLRAITFDYSGLGLSTGNKTYNPFEMVRDAVDLIDALGLHDVAICGWSLGGIVAQVMLALHPQRLTHAVLIGTSPPGPLAKMAEQLFYDVARRPTSPFEDQVVLFFEPRSQKSLAAARSSAERIAARTEGRSVPVPWEWAAANLGQAPKKEVFPAPAVLRALQTTELPVLHIGADHDIVFPIENWYALNGQLPTLQLLTFPQAGHGPHHQYPIEAAQHIATFLGVRASA